MNTLEHPNKLNAFDLGRYNGLSDRLKDAEYDSSNAFTGDESEEWKAGYRYGYTMERGAK